MPTYTQEQKEQHSQDCADAFATAESVVRALAAQIKTSKQVLGIGPVNYDAIRGKILGGLGAIADAHLDMVKYDARPSTQDGGGGK